MPEVSLLRSSLKTFLERWKEKKRIFIPDSEIAFAIFPSPFFLFTNRDARRQNLTRSKIASFARYIQCVVLNSPSFILYLEIKARGIVLPLYLLFQDNESGEIQRNTLYTHIFVSFSPTQSSSAAFPFSQPETNPV